MQMPESCPSMTRAACYLFNIIHYGGWTCIFPSLYYKHWQQNRATSINTDNVKIIMVFRSLLGAIAGIIASSCLVHCDRCYIVGSPLNAREFVLHYGGFERVLMCDGKEVFNTDRCNCRQTTDVCDKRPLSRDGTIFQQLTQAGEWVDLKCPLGLIFVRDLCICGFSSSIPRDQRNVECYMEETSNLTDFRLVINKQESVMTCPDHLIYNPQECACVARPNHCDKRRYDRTGHFFEQNTFGSTWVTMRCAQGSLFNSATCKCDIPAQRR
ncbi:uncharacterized protein [Haliotis cracherodii]|uniref:uncharacterized protein n=1 Tax=Haliotis cracherodii TaxID=6455 RepID=UPI0039ECAFD1